MSVVPVAVLLLPACGASADPSPPDIAGDNAGAGGSNGGNVAGSSGTSAGGALATPGTTGSGGTLNMGGTTSTGGTLNTGGALNMGGARNAGGSGGTQAADAGAGSDAGMLPPGAPKLTPGVWTTINPWGATPSTCGGGAYCVAVDPSDPAVVYQCSCACNQACGIYKSTDAGSSWKHVAAIPSGPGAGLQLDSANHVRIDPKNPKHLYASDGVHGATMGFWVSTDGGETFTMPAGFAARADNAAGNWNSDVYDIAADPTDFNHVLVSFHSPFSFSSSSGVLESKDGGNTWIRHYPISTLTGAGWGIWFLYRPDLGIGNSGTWLLGAQLAGHWRTTDAGGSWAKITDNNMEHGGGQIYYSADGTLYSSGQPNLMRSTDNGVIWTMMGPSFGYIGIIGDGSHLYAKAHDHTNPILTASESNGTAWSDYTPQPVEFFGGCYEYAFDRANKIVYGAYLTAGLMALKVP